MFFGFSNTLTSFQGYINNIFAKKLNIFVIIYLDNILVYIKNFGYKNLSTAINLAKFKKSILVKSKISNLGKLDIGKKLNFAKISFFKTDFLIIKIKKLLLNYKKLFSKPNFFLF